LIGSDDLELSSDFFGGESVSPTGTRGAFFGCPFPSLVQLFCLGIDDFVMRILPRRENIIKKQVSDFR
jgi:hypothetical protein